MNSILQYITANIAVGLLGLTQALADTNYPGGIIELEFDKQTQELPEVRFGLYEPAIIEQAQSWRVLIGIDLDTLPGEYVVYFRRNQQASQDEFKTILVRHRPPEALNSIDPIQPDLIRLVKNIDTWSEIDFSNTQQPSLPLQTPLTGNWSDTFGKPFIDPNSKELVNVNAVSITTTEFANIVSPQSAIVARVVTSEDGVSTVFLDHGRGLYSMIEGIGDLTVEAGNGVNVGAVLGKVPMSDDRSNSEPRTVVWQTQLNNVIVDPFILTQLKP